MNLITTSIVTTMSSREIAELTGKEHRHVLRDIEVMLAELDLNKEGYAQTWTHPQNGQTYPEFLLDRELTDTLLTGYSAVLRRKVIARWRELESRDKVALPDFTDPVAAARAWADAVEKTQVQAVELQAQKLLLEQQKPAVEFVDRFVEAKSAKGFREVAKILGIKEREFIDSLAADKIIFKQGSNWLPMAHHQHNGRFVVKTGEANGHAFHQCRFTPEGIAWVAKRFTGASSLTH